MNPLIQFVQNLKNLGNLKYAEAYFDLLQQLIQFTGLSEDDKRLSLTYQIKGTLGVNINNRRILAFRKQGKIWCMQVVINDEDIEQNRGVEGYLANLDDSFVRGNKPATLLTFSLEAKPYDNETLLQAWLKAVENDLNTSTYSIYSRYNKPFIYRSATNLQARNQILKWVKTDLPIEEVLKTLEMQQLLA